MAVIHLTYERASVERWGEPSIDRLGVPERWSRRVTHPRFAIRPLDPARPGEVELVAHRMRDTLIEVLGPERGAAMYTPAWLRDRVRFHLEHGAAFVAEDGAARVVGHTLVRVDRDEEGAPLGLIATTYVLPESRRAGIAAALLAAGEAWLVARGVPTIATNTSDTNTPLVRLYEKHGYRITLRAPEERMVRLTKAARA